MISENQQIINKLKSILGIEISNTWLEQLQTTNHDDILNILLHSDLRNVINRNCTNELHEMISKSLNDEDNPFLTISIKCTVQIEEYLDVSLNAETRFNSTPTNTNSRCFKMVLSNGYNKPIIAMEVSPIPNLFPNSKTGIKLLLFGNVRICHGVLCLHDGNTIVLGGYVQYLVDVQQKALERIRSEGGFGIDPTIKALCWNNNGAEEEVDEGEGESGDVVRVPIPPNPTVVIPHVQNHVNNTITINSIVQRTITPQSITHNNNHPQQENTPIIRSTTNTIASNNNPTSRININPYANSRSNQPSTKIQPTASNTQPISSFSKNSSKIMMEPTNPPKSPKIQEPIDLTIDLSNDDTTLITEKNEQQLNRSVIDDEDEMIIDDNGILLDNDHPFDDYNLIQPNKMNDTAIDNMNVNETTSALTIHTKMDLDEFDTTVSDTTTTASTENRIKPSHPSSSKTTKTTFSNLYNELTTILPNKYESYYKNKQTFIIEDCKLFSNKYVMFDLNKIKREGGSTYEYSFICQWGNDEKRITCKISNAVLEPFFGVSAHDIRKIRKSDRKKGDKITKDGGNRVIHAFGDKCNTVKFQLYNSYHDFMKLKNEKGDVLSDPTIPILLVVGKL